MKNVFGVLTALVFSASLFIGCMGDDSVAGSDISYNEIRIDAFTNYLQQAKLQAFEVRGDTMDFGDNTMVLVDKSYDKSATGPKPVLDTLDEDFIRILYPAKYDPSDFSCLFRQMGRFVERDGTNIAHDTLGTVFTETWLNEVEGDSFWTTFEYVEVKEEEHRHLFCTYIPGKGFLVSVPQGTTGTIVIRY